MKKKNQTNHNLTTNKCRNKEDPFWTEVTTNHYNPAVLRPERAPPTRSAPPWIGHAIRHVCEWTHRIWMAGLSAEEPGSSPPTTRPLPASPRKKAPSAARGGREPGVRQKKKCVSHVRESGWMSWVCLGACVTGSVWGWVRTRAETERRSKQHKKEKLNILTRNKFCEAQWRWRRVSGIEILPLKEADPHFPEEDEEEKKKWTWNRQNCHWGIIFVLGYC